MIPLFWPRPTHSGKAINQCAARNAKRPANCRLTGAAFKSCKHGFQLFTLQNAWSTALPSSTLSRANTRLDPFLDQGPLVLGERPKELEQQLSVRCGSIGV